MSKRLKCKDKHFLNVENLNWNNAMRYVIRKNAAGRFWFRIVSDGNNKILAASELYNEKSRCLHAIGLIKANAETAAIDDRTYETVEREDV